MEISNGVKKLLKKFIPPFLLSWYHLGLAFLGAVLYRFPSRKIKVIGVTGTKGKSTVINLAGKILEEAGYRVSWISSATLKIGEKEWLNPYHMTMPGRFFIQRFLKQALMAGCQYVILEVTSEGILQHRQRFINFETAVFTNLAPEHIERHGSFENYRKAKLKLFKNTQNIHIINLDDENSKYFLEIPAKEKYGYKIARSRTAKEIYGSPTSIVAAKNIQILSSGLKFDINNTEFNLKLLGEFNISNALAAICFGFSQGINSEISKRALAKIKGIPGRLELINLNKKQGFTAIVDLAHTPDSFEKVFKLAKSLPHRKIISVFGSAGGERDRWKRPEIGKIAARYSDYIILTNEDPYRENPLQILNEIKQGILEIKNQKSKIKNFYEIIVDRREAIRKGLSLAKKEDIVLVLGKGTEQIICIGSKKIPWDDREVVKEEFKKLNY